MTKVRQSEKALLANDSLGFEECRIRTTNQRDKAELSFSDIDFSMNARKEFFFFGEMKALGKDFATGYDPNGKLVQTRGPLWRAQSVIDAIKTEMTAIWVFAWANKDEHGVQHVCDSVVKQIYYKAPGKAKGREIVFDYPVPFMDFYYFLLSNVKTKDYPNGIIKPEEQRYFEEFFGDLPSLFEGWDLTK